MFKTEQLHRQKTELSSRVNKWLEQEVVTRIHDFETKQHIPRSFLKQCGQHQWTGANIPAAYSGLELNYQQLADVHAALGKLYSSLENVFTVIGMVSKSIVRFGTSIQKETWLPKIANGSVLPAIALTEPEGGSDLASIACTATASDDYWSINGCKTYITLGQIADLFLVLAATNVGPTAFLVPNTTPGLIIEPIKGLLGFKGNMLAKLTFTHCQLGKKYQLGIPGMGLNAVINTALDEGRFTTAWGAIGLGQACLQATYQHLDQRKNQGKSLGSQPLVLRVLSKMIVKLKAAMALGQHAAVARDNHTMSYLQDTLIAKYYNTRMAVALADAALQLHGAIGVTRDHVVSRYYRDAKIFELIEGSTTLYEMMIAELYMPDM